MSQKIMKTLTFSYDDGVTQDQRLVDLFNKYSLKCTFNLNSDLGGACALNNYQGTSYTHARFQSSEFPRVYAGHEVAVHTLTHPHLNQLSDEDIIREVEKDRLQLSEIMGYEIEGMAYPYGDGSVDARVVELIRKNTGVRYSRLTGPTYDFEPQADLLASAPAYTTGTGTGCLIWAADSSNLSPKVRNCSMYGDILMNSIWTILGTGLKNF